MPDTFNYPAKIERDEDSRFVITFPDFGWGATDGTTRDEALANAKDLLRELITTTIREGKALPEPSRPSKKQPLVIPPVQIALKAALYDAYRQTGHSQRRLARDLDVAESEVRRMLNPEHATKGNHHRRGLTPAWQAPCLDHRPSCLIPSRTEATENECMGVWTD